MTDATADERGAPVEAPDGGAAGLLRRMSIAGALACALAVSTLATYLVLLDRQGTPLNNPRVLFIAASIAVVSLLTGFGALVRQARARALSLGIATPGLLGVGFIGAWSIGTPLLLAGVLAGLAVVPALLASGIRALRLAVGGILIVGVVWAALFIGVLLTDPGRT